MLTKARTTYNAINAFLIQDTESITNQPVQEVMRMRVPTPTELAAATEARGKFQRMLEDIEQWNRANPDTPYPLGDNERESPA